MSAAIVLVAAVAENGVIGRDGGLPWRLSSDLKHFRKLTMGKPVIMGRKTFAEIGKPLDGRDNVVVTRDPDFVAHGVYVAHDIDQAMGMARDFARASGADEIAVIGGAEVYRATLPLADRIYLTRVHGVFEGDALFPALEPAAWEQISSTRHPAGPKDETDFSFVVLDRFR